jgi:hypothetical protein
MDEQLLVRRVVVSKMKEGALRSSSTKIEVASQP